jgi:glyoxylase-like metal-dependent hydrolase (beta-lactamase superfamily II)
VRAESPHLRDRASFIPELPALLRETGRLVVVEPGGAASLLGPHVRLVETEGHTPGMLHAWIRGAQGELFFCADLVPGAAWVHLPISMGYDRYPERLIDEKAELLPQLLERRAWLFFVHDPGLAAGRLVRDERGRYAIAETIDPGGCFEI